MYTLNYYTIDIVNHISEKQDLIVICYPNDWHWVLSLEYLFSKTSLGKSIQVLDLSQSGEMYLKYRLKKILGRESFQDAFYEMCRLKGIKIQKRRTYLYSIGYVFFSFTHYLIFKKTDFRTSPSFNTIAEKTGVLDFTFKEFRNLITREEFKRFEVEKSLSKMDLSCFHKIVTVNGRFTKNATVVRHSKFRGCKVNLIEFGSSNTHIAVYKKSPHSIQETQKQINRIWKSSEANYRRVTALEFIDQIRRDHDIYKIGWRSKMQSGHVPPKVKRFRCTFFASTESEFAGVGDSIKHGNFENQIKAFQSLCNLLPMEAWEIYLRRHPKNPNSKGEDPEAYLWKSFTASSHVMIVPPDSPVDSLALGLSSDLNVVFNSFIAMELIVQGARNVISTGPAPWNSLLPLQYTPSTITLKNYLKRPIPIKSVTDILPWAFYTSTHGEKFSQCTWNTRKQKWELI